MKRLIIAGLVFLGLVGSVLASAVAFGGPSDPPPMVSIGNAFKSVDYSDIPSTSHVTARDGTRLVYRVYPAVDRSGKGSIVLVHGSSSRGKSMHVLAKGFAIAGYTAYALDVRGHGESGVKGHIAYVGQLEDDLEDFVLAVKPAHPTTLAGFSAGGGFVMRFAGSNRQDLFSSYLLLAPFISQEAATYRPNSGGWVRIGLPRFIAIALLNIIGVRFFNDLPVTKFALDQEAKLALTSQYSYALAQNFRPNRDYQANIRAIGHPLRVIVGQDDDEFYADRFDGVFKAAGKDVPVTVLPGIGHVERHAGPACGSGGSGHRNEHECSDFGEQSWTPKESRPVIRLACDSLRSCASRLPACTSLEAPRTV